MRLSWYETWEYHLFPYFCTRLLKKIYEKISIAYNADNNLVNAVKSFCRSSCR